MAAKYGSVRAGDLKRLLNRICGRSGLVMEDDLKHCKVTNPRTGESFTVPLNHPGRDVPSGFVAKVRRRLAAWGACTEAEFDKGL